MISRRYFAVAAAMAIGMLAIGSQSSLSQGLDTPEYKCIDRCWAGFQLCMTPDPVCSQDPNCVATPPPYDFCLAEKQACEAQCTLVRIPKPEVKTK